ncbi:MAG: redoxin domain-containing protein [Planctomycetaceae bacterium]
MSSRRVLLLPLAAVIILGLCVWKVRQPRRTSLGGELPEVRRPAPAFQLYDQDSHLVNLESFLHRHQIVLVFFDGAQGPAASPVLNQLKQFHPALKREGVIVLGISTALPQDIRNSPGQPWPFPLLSDVAATDERSVHRTWGCFLPPPSLDRPAGTRPAVFVIDRSGLVSWKNERPQEEPHPEQLVRSVLNP